MFKIGQKIRILGIDYDVVVRNIDNENICGFTDWNKNQIVIDKNLSNENKQKTLIHEILHAINGEMSEEEIDFLAGALNQVIIDNVGPVGTTINPMPYNKHKESHHEKSQS